ncbi:hypothetical protein BpHYR1_025405 [Brachionus plicatilis]|uniref:Uncharacterized protein n=1 Tax=Brachionus plicatilis TaxID=10195 RepID=A0A3M7Q9X5_BRAPC|nr:hypothetical protein BpHYR1_025405 [Brachionus plicatilis]
MDDVENSIRLILEKHEENKIFILHVDYRLRNVEQALKLNQPTVNQVQEQIANGITSQNLPLVIENQQNHNYTQQLNEISSTLREISTTATNFKKIEIHSNWFKSNIVQILILFVGIFMSSFSAIKDLS